MIWTKDFRCLGNTLLHMDTKQTWNGNSKIYIYINMHEKKCQVHVCLVIKIFTVVSNKCEKIKLQGFVSKIWGNSHHLNSITKVLPLLGVEILHSNREWQDRVCAGADEITSLQPWFWGTAAHCGLRWLVPHRCSEHSRGTPWLAGWRALLDTGTGRSDCALLKREKKGWDDDCKSYFHHHCCFGNVGVSQCSQYIFLHYKIFQWYLENGFVIRTWFASSVLE